MRSIALGLDLEETFFEDKIHEQYHNLRLLSYPAVETEILKGEGQGRAGAHSGKSWRTLPIIRLSKSNYAPRLRNFDTPVSRFSMNEFKLYLGNPF